MLSDELFKNSTVPIRHPKIPVKL